MTTSSAPAATWLSETGPTRGATFDQTYPPITFQAKVTTSPLNRAGASHRGA